jgi:CSLREA domain-containing protein
MKNTFRALVISLTFLLVTAAASAATFVVNTTSDTVDAAPGNGVCADASAQCSLRAAISEANALAGDDIITVPAGNYTQSLVAANEDANAGGDWDITGNVTINGASAASTILQANAAVGTATERVINVRSGTVVINDVTIRNGRFTGTMLATTRGAGIENVGTLTLNNIIVRDNQMNSTSGNPIGAGIHNAGPALTLINTTVTANSNVRVTGGSAFGGGISSIVATTITITSSSISGNSSTSQAGGFGFGAGLYLENLFTFNATNSSFNNNTGTGTSGSNGTGVRALSNIGAAVFNATNCTFGGNTGTPTAGTNNQGVGVQFFTTTAVAATLTATLDRVTISGNSGNGTGIGMNTQLNGGNATITVRNSTISNNTGGTNGGGMFLTNAGSVVNSPATINFINSTLSLNTVSANGGGFAIEQPTAGVLTANFNFSTVANNTANADNSGVEAGGGIARAAGTVNLKNTIVADNNVGTGGTAPDISGSVNSQDYNHIENLTGATVTGTTANNTTGDPQLGILANNGGPTPTHLPAGASPVVDAIPNGTNDCGTTITTDQRGATRPVSTGCDKGSVEVGGVIPTDLEAPLDYNGDGITDYVVVRNTGGGSGGQVTWFIHNGATSSQTPWGISTDFFVSGDFDGDDKADITVYRPTLAPNAFFYSLRSSNSTLQARELGTTGDDPTIVGDYDGDDIDDFAVYRGGSSVGQPSFWYYRGSATVNGGITFAQYGQFSDFPAPGDYDGDGKNDFCVQRNNGSGQGVFLLRKSAGGDEAVLWGTASDLIQPGDYDGDGKDDFAVARASGGQIIWSVLGRNGNNIIHYGQPWGLSATDFPTQGDYDGDGKTDIAVWRPNADVQQNFFYIRRSSNGALQAFEWGQQGDYPVANYNSH